MPCTVTLLRPGAADPARRAITVEIETDVEALRIAQEGTTIARKRCEFVTYEVHDAQGQLLASYTSAAGGVDR